MPVAYAYPIKSSLSGRDPFAASNGSQNPYVTKGLVAMFDGEWNSGTFEHDPELDGWIDLVGGVKAVEQIEIDSRCTGTYEITENSYILTFPKPAAGTIQGYGLLHAKFDPDVANSIRHIECVYKRLDGTTDKGGALLLVNSRKYVCSFIGTSLMGQNGYSQYGQLIDDSTDLFHTYSIALTGNWPIMNAAYQDGFLLDISQYMSGYTGQYTYEEGDLFIGLRQWHGFTIEIASIRLYNRNLTPQEVSHNCTVDRERFGF